MSYQLIYLVGDEDKKSGLGETQAGAVMEIQKS